VRLPARLTFRPAPAGSFFSLALVLLAACSGRTPAGPIAFDFVAGVGLATVDQEVADITFGTPAGRAHLAEGWSIDEATPEGRPFTWSEGDQSSLDFFLAQPRALTLRLRCAPLARPDLPPQTVTVSVNGRRLVELRLEPGPRGYQTLLPAEALAAGQNRLTFRYAYAANAASGSPDRRRLAVAWFELGLGATAAPRVDPPQAEAETGGLRIPAGSQLAYHLKLPKDSSLAVDSIQLGSPRRASLVVLFQPDGEPERELARVTRSTTAWSTSLAGDAGKIVRVSFRVLPDRDEPGPGSVRLVRPVLTRGGVSPSPAASPGTAAARRPHVFIYLVDTLRADHLGCYGYPRPVSPSADAFAREATLFHAVAPSSWTKASVASLLTGRSPIVHRAQDRGDTLPAGTVTLARLLGAAGYRTYALYANSWVSETFGLDQGFEERRFLFARSDRLSHELFGRLRRLAPDDRLFAYVQTIDPHAPYDPTPEFRARFAPPGSRLQRASIEWLEDLATRGRRGEPIPRRLVEEITALYDAEIAFNDRQFGLFLEELKRRGLYDASLIVFTSDHGEELFDHGGVSHGHTLFREVLEVPLIVKWPGGVAAPPGANGSRAQLLDLVPTVLDCASLPVPSGLEGRSLLRPPPAEPPPGGNGILSYLDLDGLKAQSVTEDRWKLVRNGDLDAPRPGIGLYDLDEGRETNDRRGLHPVVAAHLASQLAAEVARRPRTPPPPQAVLPAEVVERLKALGYVR
jgi:arylsulfatase A-like enzyme